MTQDPRNDEPQASSQAPESGAPSSAAQEAPEALHLQDTIPFADTRVAELQAQVDQLKDQALRAMAETENTRRRLEQQAEDRARYALSAFALDMLAVADNLGRAIGAVPEEQRQSAGELFANLLAGVEMTERQLQSTFERYAIRPIAAEGERFDPNLHQAMMEIEDPSKPAGTVVMVMQPGYTIHDRLLRPAMVGVAKGGAKASAS